MNHQAILIKSTKGFYLCDGSLIKCFNNRIDKLQYPKMVSINFWKLSFITTLHCRRLYCNVLQVDNFIILSYNVNMWVNSSINPGKHYKSRLECRTKSCWHVYCWVLCDNDGTSQKGFHQVHEPTWAVHEGSQTVCEPFMDNIMCNNKRIKWVSWAASWVINLMNWLVKQFMNHI